MNVPCAISWDKRQSELVIAKHSQRQRKLSEAIYQDVVPCSSKQELLVCFPLLKDSLSSNYRGPVLQDKIV